MNQPVNMARSAVHAAAHTAARVAAVLLVAAAPCSALAQTADKLDRSVLPIADAANDQPTLDLLTQRLDIHEKNAWMLRSLLKK